MKAIQDLSKTQNEIFGRAMSSIPDEILTSVTKHHRPVIHDEVKILKDEIRMEIMTHKDTLKGSKSVLTNNNEKLLRDQMTVKEI